MLHGCDMGQTQVSLFGGDGLEQLLHFGEIHRTGFQQWRHIERHGVDLGSEANNVLGMSAQ
jgi:hypothetical protein